MTRDNPFSRVNINYFTNGCEIYHSVAGHVSCLNSILLMLGFCMSFDPHPSYAEVVRIRDRARHPRIVALLDYYLQIHPREKLPSREDFDPFQVPKAMPNMALMDVERNPYRFKYRVMGTTVSYNMEFDGTGKYLDDLVPGVEAQYPHLDRVQVAETGMPVYRLGQSSVSFRSDFADLERVHLPLASDGKTVDMILSIFIYFADQ